ncbi:MAG: carbohydrate kinase, partial [Sphingobacteriaceae bacterium]
YIGADGKPLTPLYNYLKPYPEELAAKFYGTYGGEETVSVKTASPVLGSLNSGMQLYRLKYNQPDVFAKVTAALHLPQYLSYLLTGEAYSDLTSIGCHTGLWDFETNDYHQWVAQEGISEKLPPVAAANTVKPALFPGSTFEVGIGLHDSSAALIPYMVNFNEPFILISTGTWCISLNPFNQSPLTAQQLTDDCLCYLGFQGKPVKASRLFAGYEHETQVKRITDHFGENVQRYRTMDFDAEVINRLQKRPSIYPTEFKKTSVFAERALNDFADDTEAYHQLILDLVQLQVISTKFILEDSAAKRIFVDGGFSKNAIFMNLLAAAFPDIEVFAASMAQASAVGAALAIHNKWNTKPVPKDIIQLKYYSAVQTISI